MSCSDFIGNLEGLNGGTDFPKELLKVNLFVLHGWPSSRRRSKSFGLDHMRCYEYKMHLHARTVMIPEPAVVYLPC